MKRYLWVFSILAINGCLTDLDTSSVSPCVKSNAEPHTCYFIKQGDEKLVLRTADYGRYDIRRDEIPPTFRDGTDSRGFWCVNLQSDKAHCGTCGNACDESGICENGSCICQQACEKNEICNERGKCICRVDGIEILTYNTNEHCDACGRKCQGNLSCIRHENGHYYCGCPTGQVYCSNECADLTSDPLHCGSCDINCMRQTDHADGIKCRKGSCDYDQCRENYLDLDENRANGCEHDAKGDVEHCGSADLNCSDEVQHADGIKCRNGQCDYGKCEKNYLDSDENRANGCEYNASSDVVQCGSNAVNCNKEIIEADPIFCNNGSCDYGKCKKNFLDLDNNRANGCEHDAKSDVRHCGSADLNCSDQDKVQHADGIKCRNGQCDYDKCKKNYLDLDKDRANGCEHDASSNVEHCGSADLNCLKEVRHADGIKCSDGQCDYDGDCKREPDPPWVLGSVDWTDWDKNRANGCEQAISGDVMACGNNDKVNCLETVVNAYEIYCHRNFHHAIDDIYITYECDYGECERCYVDSDNNRANGCEKFNIFCLSGIEIQK